ncbi:hypothetical protein LR48_Vigan08g162300 [Vigna angularis]|uniref:Beta-glucosidase n=1 Tax=Phaseolus angularis TaxID=3914 RepID=A0A0L9V6W5_PHAAN|nr:hypothetical protein LR48_Vigan08g162300 [Vigna angularis]
MAYNRYYFHVLLPLIVILSLLIITNTEGVAAPEIPLLNRNSFPPGFIFGTASSAYQYEGAANEGGKGSSIWDTFTHKYPDKIKDRGNGDVAVDSYNRYKKAAKLVKRSLSCLSPRVKGEEEEKEEELVHQNSVKASDEPKHGKPVKFKNRLWVIKNIKINGVLEIEAPYFRRVKLVTRKLLRGCWCHDKKMHCNIKNQT